MGITGLHIKMYDEYSGEELNAKLKFENVSSEDAPLFVKVVKRATEYFKNCQSSLFKLMLIMLKLFFVFLGLSLLFLSSSCCNSKAPEAVAAVRIKFEGLKDSYQSRAWVIETAKGDSSIKIDSVYYGLMHHVVDYSFDLEFRKAGPNGDYHIYADSVKGPHVITEFVLNIDQDKCGNDLITYTYRFNGIFETEKVHELTIHK